jgi:hypothetical protein
VIVALLAAGSIVAACSSDGGSADDASGTEVPASSTTVGSTDSTTPAEPAEPLEAALVAGTMTFTVSEGTVTTNDDGSSESRDGSVTEEFTSADARVAGTATETWETDRWGQSASDGALVQWGTGELTNDGGSWEGTYSGIYSTETGDVLYRWWTGGGDYEGLTFFTWITDSTTSTWEWSGLIYPGTPPLTSEPRAESMADAATGSEPVTTDAAEATTTEGPSESTVIPAPIEYSGATLVGGTFNFQVSGGTSTLGDEGAIEWRDWVFTQEVTSNDPRTAGVMDGTWQADVWNDRIQVQWGTAALTNDGGSWEGAYSGMFDNEIGDIRFMWWTGTGDYEGYTLFMWTTADSSARRGSGSPSVVATHQWTGLIYPGTPPFVETPAE